MKRKNIIPYEPVGRLIMQAGAKRVSANAKVTLTNHLEDYAQQLGALAIKFANHAGRKTIIQEDIILAKKQVDL